MSRRVIGVLLLLAAFALTIIAYHFSWKSGCLFDWKQGTGDYRTADEASTKAFLAVCAALLLVVAAVPLIWRPTIWALLGSLLFFGVLGGPMATLLLGAAGNSGTQSCKP